MKMRETSKFQRDFTKLSSLNYIEGKAYANINLFKFRKYST